MVMLKTTQPSKQVLFFIYLLIGYLIWWDIREESPGYYDRPNIADYIALSALAILALLGIYAIVRIFRYKSFLAMLIPLIIYLTYQMRIFEGRSVFTFHDCDMSVCVDAELKETGIWREQSASQVSTLNSVGTFDVKNDTVYLYHNFWHLNLFSRARLQPLQRDSRINYKHVDKTNYASAWYNDHRFWR